MTTAAGTGRRAEAASRAVAGQPERHEAAAATGARTTLRPDRSKRPLLVKGLIAAGLLGFGLLFVYPFIWLLSASFKPRGDVFDNRLIPETFTWDNYVTVWQQAPLAVWILNTVIVTVLAATTVAVSSAMVAWGFSYFEFRGRSALFGVVLATMMLPGAVTMVPVFLIWNALGQVGTLTPLWAANMFGSAFYIFLLRQFFLGLPRSLFDAARIDGASNWVIFARIAVPLCKPAIIVTLIFEFQASWTNLMASLIYLRDSSTFTVPRGLKALLDQFGFGGNWNWEVVVTASVITTIPMIVLFFLAQRHFVEGIATTGAKN